MVKSRIDSLLIEALTLTPLASCYFERRTLSSKYSLVARAAEISGDLAFAVGFCN